MATPHNTSSLARFPEVTQGTGPADAAAWVSDSVRVRHIMGTLDTAAFKQSTIEDERSQENVQDEEPKILGIKGGVEFGHECYAHGLTAVAASGATVVQNELSEDLEHCMGGVHLSNATVATGGTNLTAILTADTAIEVGCYLCVVLPDFPPYNFPRRVVAYNAGTNTVTFDEVLPRAVAAPDVIHGCATHYFDEDVLNDSSVGPTTRSHHLTQGRGSDREYWVANGCKTYIESIALPRNGAPKFIFKTKVASFYTPDELADPTWVDAPDGDAPTAIGPRTRLFLQDYGTTTAASRHCIDMAIKPGGAPEACETGTEVQTGMPGISHYGLARDKSTATFKTILDQGEFADFTAGTLKVMRWTRNGAAGAGFAVAFHRCEVRETPTPQAIGPSLGMELELHALRDTTVVATTDLWRSRMVIVTW